MNTLPISWHDDPDGDYNENEPFEFSVLEATPEDGGPTLFIEYAGDGHYGPLLQVQWLDLIAALEREGWDAEALFLASPTAAFRSIA